MIKSFSFNNLESTLILAFLLFNFTQAQNSSPSDLPTIIPPSPTVASLMKIEEIPVDYYTGQPSISIPIYNKNIAPNTPLNLALNYSTTNLKVTERSSWTGVSWSLSGEAVISRTVRGIPDEYYKTHPSNQFRDTKQVGVLHNNYFGIDWSNPASASDFETKNFLWNTMGWGSGQVYQEGAFDKDLDLYQVNIFGETARFVIHRLQPPSSTLIIKYLENNSNLKVEVNNYDPLTFEINSFKVTDVNGNQYILNQPELTQSRNVTFTEYQDGSDINPSELTNTYKSAWKVSSVLNSNDQSLLSYNYYDIEEKLATGIVKTKNYINAITLEEGNFYLQDQNIPETFVRNVDHTGFNFSYIKVFEKDPQYPTPGYEDYNNSIALPKETNQITFLTIDTKKPQLITFNDGVEIHFETSTDHHMEYDDNSGKVLERIIILNNNNSNALKTVDFEYNSQGPDVDDYQRLFLDKISFKKDILSTESMDYILSYYKPEELVPNSTLSLSFSDITDIWGYYNEPSDIWMPTSWEIHKSSANEESVKYGSLLRIDYPTSGFKEFEFESNKINSLGDRDLTDYEFYDKNIINSTLEQSSVVFNSHTSNDYQLVQGPDVLFTIDFEQDVSFYKNFIFGDPTDPSVISYLNNLSFVIEKFNTSNNSFEFYTGGSFDKDGLQRLEAGSYIMSFRNLSVSTTNQVPLHVESKMYFRSAKNTLQRYVAGGGLRIKTIKDYESLGGLPLTTKFIYDDGPLGLTLLPNIINHYGVIDGVLDHDNWYDFEKSYEFAIVTEISSGNNGLTGTVDPYTLHYDVTQYNYMPRSSLTKGGYVGYSKVKIIKSDDNFLGNNYLGVTELEYSNPKDYPSNSQYSYIWPFTPTRDLSFKHGLLKTKKIYDQQDRILSEEINEFDYFQEPIGITLFPVERKDCARTVYYHTLQNYINQTQDVSPLSSGTSGYYGDCGSVSPLITPVLLHNVLNIDFFNFSYLKSSSQKSYYYDSSNNPTIVSNTTTSTYNPNNLQLNKQITTNSEGETIENQIVYSDFYLQGNSPSTISSLFNASDIIIINEMRTNANMKESPILQRSYLNNELTSTVQYIYDQPLTNQFVATEVRTAKGDMPSESRLKYHRYDEFGNVLDVSKKDGTHVSYIWGHNGSLPIAKIEGLSYADLASRLGITEQQLDAFDETDLSAIDALRSAFSVEDPFLLTTYEYEVGVGITKMTDPRGRSTIYEYDDDFNRLERVVDHDGNVLSENEYKYATQN
ncbi:RHS repeat protein [Nonlabens xiamenensis]|uniref:RHS repeat protein n=1 Tax=Nonlabens xiamenensis TaxID=2341043 RepID=UPI000F60FF7E|nr:RHS repeat protein [Nonlabens xiamenensis]